MSRIDLQQILDMDKRYRTHFINSLSGYKSANLLGTCNAEGASNLAIMSSVFHVGANPPLIGMLMRPHTVPRHSLENLRERGVYTLNQVHVEIFDKAHQTSARYPRDISEFEACNLTEQYRDDFPAPFVAESHVQIAMKVCDIHLMDINQTELVIGEVQVVYLNDQYIADDGFIDLNALNAVCISGLDAYHQPQQLDRLPYAKINGRSPVLES